MAIWTFLGFMATALMTDITLNDWLLLIVIIGSSNVIGLIVLVLSLVTLSLGYSSCSVGTSSKLAVPALLILTNALGLIVQASLVFSLLVTILNAVETWTFEAINLTRTIGFYEIDRFNRCKKRLHQRLIPLENINAQIVKGSSRRWWGNLQLQIAVHGIIR